MDLLDDRHGQPNAGSLACINGVCRLCNSVRQHDVQEIASVADVHWT